MFTAVVITTAPLAKCSLSKRSAIVSLLVGGETHHRVAYRDARSIFERAYWDRKRARRMSRRLGMPYDHKEEAAFCTARHNIMTALLKLQEEDASALIQKARLMSLAGLPSELNFDDVLHYVEGSRRVHLFYGGETSPDGRGHGHAVLVEWRAGRYTIVYHRKPSRR